jgi:viroplasmin and RNaseH domain-containing protein
LYRDYPTIEEAQYYLEQEVEASIERGNQICRVKKDRVELVKQGLKVWREKYWIKKLDV